MGFEDGGDDLALDLPVYFALFHEVEDVAVFAHGLLHEGRHDFEFV